MPTGGQNFAGLGRDLAESLTPLADRPSHRLLQRYRSFLYQPKSWKKVRRVVAQVEFRAGDVFPPMGFLLTNLKTEGTALVRDRSKRGTAGQWIEAEASRP